MRRDAIDNRAKVLAAAIEAFALHGIGTRIDHVTALAGVTAPTVYRHFGSRDGLVHAVLDARMNALVAQLDALGALPPIDRWHRTVATLAGAVADDRLLVRVALYADPDGHESDAARMLDAAVDRALRAAKRAGAVERSVTGADVVVMLGAIDRLVELGRATPREVRRVAGRIVRSLSPSPSALPRIHPLKA
jgi:AcrR family transcriptional regulator